MKNLKKGEVLNIDFFVNIDQRFPPPVIVKLKLNGKQLCPEKNFDGSCAGFDIISNGTGGRYDAVMTIYPHQIFNGARKIDLEFDAKSWAVGVRLKLFPYHEYLVIFLYPLQNDLGESVTNDQKHYTIFNNNINSNQPITINFFVKYDEFEEVPMLTTLAVDDIPICLPQNKNDENFKRSNFQSTVPPPFKRESNMLLTDLPFGSFPQVTNSPQQVFNVSFESKFLKMFIITKSSFFNHF
jgi:hypothetical protein